MRQKPRHSEAPPAPPREGAPPPVPQQQPPRAAVDLAMPDGACTDRPLGSRVQLWPQWFHGVEGGGSWDVETLAHSVPDEVVRQIGLDVPRTQPDRLGPADREALRRILLAYAAKDPVVGYCQGLNNVAAVFVILRFDEATALRGLYTLLQSCPGYHGPGLKGYLRDVAVVDALVRQVLPAGIQLRLESLEIPLDVLASDHFLSLTSHTWPLSATVQLWDVIFAEGQPALFASFLALLQIYLPEVNDGKELGNCGSIPGAVIECVEPVDVFRQAVRKGVAEDFATVLQRVRELTKRIPQALIDKLRAGAA